MASEEPPTVDVDDLPVAHATAAPHSEPAGSASAASAPGVPPQNPESPWTVAAEAMRAGDYGAAERAFDDLMRSDDTHTRDEARLARAQLWMAEGRSAQARSELQDLAASATTALVRRRAADALQGSP